MTRARTCVFLSVFAGFEHASVDVAMAARRSRCLKAAVVSFPLGALGGGGLAILRPPSLLPSPLCKAEGALVCEEVTASMSRPPSPPPPPQLCKADGMVRACCPQYQHCTLGGGEQNVSGISRGHQA